VKDARPSTSYQKQSDNVIIAEPPVNRDTQIFELCTPTDYNTQILSNQCLILENINKLYATLNTVIENQKNIGQKLAVLCVQVDDTNTKIETMEQSSHVTLLKDASSAESESFTLRDIDNLKQLEDFELSLLDLAQRKKMKSLLSILCSASQGNGITCAYRLLDTLLTKDFLCRCSWSGGSRGDSSKIALKDHKLFLKIFF
jgi:hypothetical protein